MIKHFWLQLLAGVLLVPVVMLTGCSGSHNTRGSGAAVAESQAVSTISQLVLWERQSRVRHLNDELLDCFFPDATVTISWVSGSVQDYVAGGQARNIDDARAIVNRLGPAVVHLKGNRAIVELPSTTTRWFIVNGTEAVLDSFMRLIYRVECRNGVWKIVDLTSINEGDNLYPVIAGENLHIDPKEIEGFRHSYRFLTYIRKLGGDLLGVDRPDDVDRMYREAFAWRDTQ